MDSKIFALYYIQIKFFWKTLLKKNNPNAEKIN